MTRFALISFGNDEPYGLMFVGTEMKRHGDIKFFDAEFTGHDDLIDSICDYHPDYICFSPMTVYYKQAKEIEKSVKSRIDTVSVFGGHHATNAKESLGDITVVGAVHGLDLSRRGIVYQGITHPENLKTPAREEYYRDIPRMKNRYRKVMLSVTGCPFSCSYCSSASEVTKKNFGTTTLHLKHRAIDDIIEEAKFIKDTTHEIEWVDDDILHGDMAWLVEFLGRWKSEIGLPMYVSTTSKNALKAPPEALNALKSSCNCIGLGVQAIRPESLKLLGRAWDSKEQIRQAYDRLTAYGFRVNLQAIIGLPVEDPVGDALDTVEALTHMGTGSICSVYPLQIYPNTRMEKYCLENGFKINDACSGDTSSGMGAIDFGDMVNRRIKNICKLATMVVKYGISRRWLESMLDIEVGESSKNLNLTRYYECIKDRLPEKAEDIFNSVITGMHLRH